MEKAARCPLSRYWEVFARPYRKIENSKQYIASEAKRTNDTLLAFQHKFDFEIKKTRDDLQNNINALTKDSNAKFEQKNKEVADLNKDLAEEAKNRNNQFEEGQRDTKEKIDSKYWVS